MKYDTSRRLWLLIAAIATGVSSACATTTTTGAANGPSEPPASITFDVDALGTVLDIGARDTANIREDARQLTDDIGPRLTGSPGMTRAAEWAMARLKTLGLDSVHQESWTLVRGWRRGPMSLRLVAPYVQPLAGASWGWTPGTHGPAIGDLVYVNSRTDSAFRADFAGRIRGAWVLAATPAYVENPQRPPLDSATVARLHAEFRAANMPRTPEERDFAMKEIDLLAREGIAGLMVESQRPDGLIAMGGAPLPDGFPFPTLMLAHPAYGLLFRLLESGQRPRIEADIHNTLGPDSIPQPNVMAEIRGRDRPNEVVILGAHLDSWDLASGATDNAAGVVAVMAAARILKNAGVRPSRTIRFVLFGGEEEGELGSSAYVAQHASELRDIQAALVLDNGTGRITGIPLQGRDDLAALWRGIFATVGTIGPFTVRSASKVSTDHYPFASHGIPAFNYDQESRAYEYTHHTMLDTFDELMIDDLAQAATVMAANALVLADLPSRIPHARPAVPPSHP